MHMQMNKNEFNDYTCWATISESEILFYENLVAKYGCQLSLHEIHELNIKEQISLPVIMKNFFLEDNYYPISGLDFSSLYPSLIMSYNFSPEYMIKTKKEAIKMKKLGHNISRIQFQFGQVDIEGWVVKHDNKMDINKIDFKFGIYPTILKELFDKRKIMKKEKIQLENLLEQFKKMGTPKFNSPSIQNQYNKILFKFNYVNSKQKALKLFMNCFYGECGCQNSPFFIPQIAGGITTKGQLHIKQAKQITEDLSCNVYYGDSVTNDTPVLIRENNRINIVKIEILFTHTHLEYQLDKHFKLHQKEICYIKKKIEIFSHTGWTKLIKIIRHTCHKQIFRILTHIGCVDVTEDHSLLNSKCAKISPNNCTIGTKLFHNFVSFNIIKKLKLNDIKLHLKLLKYLNLSIDEQIAFIFGLFFSNGSSGCYKSNLDIKYSWALNNSDLSLLETSLIMLKNIYGHQSAFEILNTIQISGTFKLVSKYNIKFMSDLFSQCYDNQHNKIIPSKILNAPYTIRKWFLIGLFASVGHKLKKLSISQNNKISIAHIYYLIKSLGYNCFINLKTDDLNVYKLMFTTNNLIKNSNKIKKIINLGTNNDYVYDLETKQHTFQAGVGELIVHNTDSIYLSIPVKYFDKIDRLYYSNKINKQSYWERLVEITFQEIPKIRDNVNNYFLKHTGSNFLHMAYEEALFPCAFLAKKKYYGSKHMAIANFTNPEIFIRGLEVKKRGTSDFLKKIYTEIMNESLSLTNTKTILKIVTDKIDQIYNKQWQFNDFIKTDVYRPNKQNIKVQSFVKRMKSQNITIKPLERFQYVIVKKYPYIYSRTGRTINLKIGDKMELTNVAKHRHLELDIDYYMQCSVNSQLARLISYHPLFDYVSDDPDEVENKIYKNSVKYIQNFCAKYYTTYNSKGSLYQGLYRYVNKFVKQKINKENKNLFVNGLFWNDVGKEDVAEKIRKKAYSVCKNKYKKYGRTYIKSKTQNLDTNAYNQKIIRLQKKYYAHDFKNKEYVTVSVRLHAETDIHINKILNSINNEINEIYKLYSIKESLIDDLMNDIKVDLNLEESYKKSNSDIPKFTEIQSKINDENLVAKLNDKYSKVGNDKISVIMKIIKKEYSHLLVVYDKFCKYNSIIEYLKTLSNKYAEIAPPDLNLEDKILLEREKCDKMLRGSIF